MTWPIWVRSRRLRGILIGEVHRKVDVLREQPLEQLRRARDDSVHRVGVKGDSLFPAEGEEALGEIGGPLRRGHDLVYVGPVDVILAELF